MRLLGGNATANATSAASAANGGLNRQPRRWFAYSAQPGEVQKQWFALLFSAAHKLAGGTLPQPHFVIHRVEAPM